MKKIVDLWSSFDLPPDLSQQPYTGTKFQLGEISWHMGIALGPRVVESLAQPTVSALVREAKRLSHDAWDILQEQSPFELNPSFKQFVKGEFRKGFDRSAHKFLTGSDLPQSLDGFSHNALANIRQATDHGDGSLFLYRIRYWWPKASIKRQGKIWIAKTHNQWAEELGMPLRSFRTAYDYLVKNDFIETMTAEFRGYPMTHLRPTPQSEKLFSLG